MMNDSIARNRFGLGTRPGDPRLSDPRRWLIAQLEEYEPLPAPWEAVQRTSVRTKDWVEEQSALRKAPEAQRAGVREHYLHKGRAAYLSGVEARTNSALQSPTPFVERLTHFWSNHFAVSVEKLAVMGLAAGFEADAIRPHVLGRFEDMLLASVRHPAMLLFLDQSISMGPNSPAGQRSNARAQGRPIPGLNENLAREILELHTLGVRSGFTQEDVMELARALTGWTLPSLDSSLERGQSFRFHADLHEPGVRKVLGRSYSDEGERQAYTILHDLAAAPATARHIAIKLARHFSADTPPPELVRRLTDTFLQTHGDLPSLYQELVAAPDAWGPGMGKFKSPWDWAISAMRALNIKNMPATRISYLMSQLGQPVWRPGAPSGYGDVTATWAAPDALLRRVEVAQRLAMQVGDRFDARMLAPRVLSDSLSQTTAEAIAAAESPSTALALLLIAPEFLRR